MTPYAVIEGDLSFGIIVDRLFPAAVRDVAAGYLWRAAGKPGVVHVDQILWYDPTHPALTDAPVVEPPAPESSAVWLEVDVGPGNNTNRRRIVVPEPYPTAGVSFYLNGTLNRTDPTGRNEGSEFHTYPPVTLSEGDVLRAEWDGYVHEYVVPVTSEPPEEPPEEPAPEPPGEPWEPGSRPDETNTGLTGPLTETRTGTTTISTPGVYEDTNYTGRVNVRADGVTFRNCLFSGGVYGIDNNVFSGNPTTGLVVEDCEFTGQSSAALLVSNTAVLRCYFHDQGADAIKAFRHVEVYDSYFTRLGSNAGSHSDGVQMVNGGPLTVRGCNFDMPHQDTEFTNSQVFMIASSSGPIRDVSIRNNWINGGSITCQVHSVDGVAEVVDNRFGRDYQFGLFSTTGPVNTSGNVWDDTGQPI